MEDNNKRIIDNVGIDDDGSGEDAILSYNHHHHHSKLSHSSRHHSHSSSHHSHSSSHHSHSSRYHSHSSRYHSHRSKHHKSQHTSSQKGKKKKIVEFIKNHKSAIVNIASCSLSVLLLVLFALNIDFSKQKSTDNNNSELTQSTIIIETSVYVDEIPLASEAVNYYMNDNNDSSVLEVYKSYGGYKGGLDKGLPLNFTYKVSGLPSEVDVEVAKLEISENENYKDSQTFNLDVVNSNINIYNLKTDFLYYYRLNLTLTDNCVVGTVGTFKTEDSPRMLNIDGISNVRDIGGWKVAGGKEICQGLLYRGTELDGEVEPKYCLTETGLNQMLLDLGIRYDMELRSLRDNKSGKDALGKNVIHEYYDSASYSDVLNDKNTQTIRKIFSDLSKKDNYPMYIHCTYGRDRTGTICYLLEALLGMSDDDLYKEYELTAFTDSYVNTQEFDKFIACVNLLEGKSTKDKVEKWLLSIGVTEKEISDIREIFLEESK